MKRQRFRRRVIGEFRQAGCAGLIPGLYCKHGPTVTHEACEIWGPPPRMLLATINGAINHGLSHRFTPGQVAAIREYMIASNDSLWHAVSVVLGAPRCPCARCQPKDPRWPWSPFNPANQLEAAAP